MPSIYRVAKAFWRRLPGPVRQLLSRVRAVRALQDATVRRFQRYASHDEIYDEQFFVEYNDPLVAESVAVMGGSIIETFAPESAIDVGCGSGDLLHVLQQQGVRAVGLEYASAAVKLCRGKDLDVHQFDLEVDEYDGPRDFDVVISLETAEHLPEHVADRYVGLLTSIGPVVVFTAATPGQGGTDHVNEQPPEYWEERFAKRGMHRDDAVTAQMRREWREKNVLWFYQRNLQVFRRVS